MQHLDDGRFKSHPAIEFMHTTTRLQSYPGNFKARVRCRRSDRPQVIVSKTDPRCATVVPFTIRPSEVFYPFVLRLSQTSCLPMYFSQPRFRFHLASMTLLKSLRSSWTSSICLVCSREVVLYPQQRAVFVTVFKMIHCAS